MNLIIDPNPKNDQYSLNSALASRLAQALGGKTKSIRIYDREQKYFNYKYNSSWIDSIRKAQCLIFPVPMWNFGIPAALKDFFDKVSQRDKLWNFDKNKNYTGLLKNHRAYIIMTSGDYYPPNAPNDFVIPYLKTILSFLGIRKIYVFRLGGVRNKNLVEDSVYLTEKTKEMLFTFGLKKNKKPNR